MKLFSIVASTKLQNNSPIMYGINKLLNIFTRSYYKHVLRQLNTTNDSDNSTLIDDSYN